MRAHAVFTNKEDFLAVIERFNPDIEIIETINGKPRSEYGDNVPEFVMNFSTNSDNLSGFVPERTHKMSDKKKSFFVTDRYQKIEYDRVCTEVLDSMEQKFGIQPVKYFASFQPGRVQVLMDFDKIISRDIPSQIIPFESSINNVHALDYPVPSNAEHRTELYNQGILLDIGYNGKQGISVFPTYLRCWCENLSIATDKMASAETFSHLSTRILENIARSIVDSEAFHDDYTKILNFANFLKFVEEVYGSKALNFVLTLDFKQEVVNSFCLYYALNALTLLQRGIGKVKGWGITPKSIAATKSFNNFVANS